MDDLLHRSVADLMVPDESRIVLGLHLETEENSIYNEQNNAGKKLLKQAVRTFDNRNYWTLWLWLINFKAKFLQSKSMYFGTLAY